MYEGLPTPEQINLRLSQGCSYAEAIDNAERNEQVFNKHANFKMKTVMSDKNKKQERIDPEDINQETFRWRLGDKELKLDEMDLDLKLTAIVHALKHANNNYSKYNKHKRKADVFYGNTKYFMRLCEVLEDSLLEDHNLQVPTEVDDIRSMRRMIKEGVISVDNFNQANVSNQDENE